PSGTRGSRTSPGPAPPEFRKPTPAESQGERHGVAGGGWGGGRPAGGAEGGGGGRAPGGRPRLGGAPPGEASRRGGPAPGARAGHRPGGLDGEIAPLMGQEQLWIKDGWHRKFKRPADPDDTGYQHTAQQVRAFASPSAAIQLEYLRVAVERTKTYLASLPPAE